MNVIDRDAYNSLFSDLSSWKERHDAIDADTEKRRRELGKLWDCLEKCGKILTLNMPNAEAQLNQLIGQGKDFNGEDYISEPLSFYTRLKDDCFEKLLNIQQSIDKYKAKYEDFRQRPNRHGCLNLTDGMRKFFSNVQSANIDRLDKIIQGFANNDKKIAMVEDAFKEEADKVSVISNNVDILLTHLKFHDNHKDRFGLHEMCRASRASLNKIKMSPNYEDLSFDERLLEEIRANIISCENLFKEERCKIEELGDLLKQQPGKIWKERHIEIQKIVASASGDGIYDSISYEELLVRYNNYVNQKEADIRGLLDCYPKEFHTKLQKDLFEIRNNCVDSSILISAKQVWDNYGYNSN